MSRQLSTPPNGRTNQKNLNVRSSSEFAQNSKKEMIQVSLAAPRGFCAGVERAIRTVENALKTHGAPVYVRHEIVHNAHVIARLKEMGAIFLENIQDVPDDRPLVFSAHGSPKSAYNEANDRRIELIDATCPLVHKVHNQARRLADRGYHIILIGHKGHQEVTGTMGQVSPDKITLVETINDANELTFPHQPLAYVTQTTLSVDEADAIITALKKRFSNIVGPAKADICYATSNRQAAIKAIAPNVDLVVVIGSQTSSNSKRMVEVALENGAHNAVLTEGAGSFNWKSLEGVATIGLSAGASAPEYLVEDFLTQLAKRFSIAIKTIEIARETISFKMPTIISSNNT